MNRHIYVEYGAGNRQQFDCMDYKFIEGQFQYLHKGYWYTIFLNGIKSITIFNTDDVENRLIFLKGVDF